MQLLWLLTKLQPKLPNALPHSLFATHQMLVLVTKLVLCHLLLPISLQRMQFQKEEMQYFHLHYKSLPQLLNLFGLIHRFLKLREEFHPNYQVILQQVVQIVIQQLLLHDLLVMDLFELLFLYLYCLIILLVNNLGFASLKQFREAKLKHREQLRQGHHEPLNIHDHF